MRIRWQIYQEKKIEIVIDDREGTIIFKDEFLNRGPFHIPLLNFDLFKQAVFDDEQGLLEWPNGFGLSVTEIYDWLEDKNTIYIT